MSTHLAARCALALLLFVGARAHAAPCEGAIQRGDVARCALAASLDVRRARQRLDVIAGQRRAAGVLLPSNPVVAVSLASRTPPVRVAEPTTLNWYVTLSQEIEIGGQRGARLARVDAEAAAQVRRVAVAEQDVIALGLTSYFDVLAARSAADLTSRLEEVAQLLGMFADERAKSSLIAPVDADLVRAEVIRVALLRRDAERRLLEAQSHLASLLGRDPSLEMAVEGDLATDLPKADSARESSLSSFWIERALKLRGDVAAAEMERAVLQRQLSLLRRSRAPNITLSAYAQRDGIDEQVFGGGISFPIPLPEPIGRTHRGDILETSALVAQAETSIESIRRNVRERVVEARIDERSRASALTLFSPELLARAATDLANIREGLLSKQLSVRDALLAQRTLIELLLGHVDACWRYALAWIELRRASGMLTVEEVTQ